MRNIGPTTTGADDVPKFSQLPSVPVQSVNGKTGIVVVNKSDVGLGSVDNTADTAKPVSTAQQSALDAKAPLASPALTGVPTAPTAAASTSTTQISTTAQTQAAIALNGPKILVLSAAASIPGGTPAGTVIIRTVT